MTLVKASEEQFSDELLRSFERTAFRLEAQPEYAVGFEREEFERFLAGSPRSPSEIGWWRPWLDQVARLTSEGKKVHRIRVLTEPPTDYQRWMMWAAPWYAEAGEQISYMTRSRAVRIGLPLDHDWWLFDDRVVIEMRFTEAGDLASRRLVTTSPMIKFYRGWQDLAVQNATTAEKFAAA